MRFMRMTRFWKGVAGVAVVSGLGFLGACSDAGSGDLFALADQNKDGGLDREELSTYLLEAVYVSGDANGDGKITLEEWQVVNPKVEKARFYSHDLDKDGAVSPAEMKESTRKKGSFDKLFKAMDTDGSGKVDRAEAKAFYAELQKAEGTNDLQKLSNMMR